MTKSKVEYKTLRSLPPSPEKCQICAAAHKPDEPHNQESLYYQMTFRMTNKRFPTWEDAISHCSKEVKNIWRKELQKAGR